MKKFVSILLIFNFLPILSGFNLHPVRYLFLKAKWVNSFSHYYYIIVLLILILSNGVKLKAQRYNFRNFSVEHGLSQSSVYAICQDNKGYLWFATDGGGVSKFDGIKFVNYNTTDGLVKNSINVILEDRKGNLWFGSAGGGLSKLIASDNENLPPVFINFTTDDGLCNNNVRAICEDSKGHLWFGTDGGGVSEFDGKRFYNYNEKNGLYSINIFSIIKDQQGNLVFGTGNGVYKYYRRIGFVNITRKQAINKFPVFSIIQDSKGNYWFGSFGGGLTKYNPNEHPDYQFINFTVRDGLSNNKIWAIIEDKSSNLWFSTDGGGVCMLSRETLYEQSKGRGQYRFNKFTSAEGLCSDEILSIFQDREGNIWLGTSGAGICKFESMRFSIYSEKGGLADNMVFSIFEDRSGSYWFGTYGGISKYDPDKLHYTNYSVNDGLIHNKVRQIIEDRKGDLWIATREGVSKLVRDKSRGSRPIFINYAEKDTCPDGSINCIGGLSNNLVYTVFEDRQGNIWFGTYESGVTKLNVSQNKGRDPSPQFTYYTEKDGLANNTVRTIYQDSKGYLWFGTKGGVSKLIPGDPLHQRSNPDTLVPRYGAGIEHQTSKGSPQHFINYTEKDGLSNNYVFTILEDDKGNMWFGTYGGGVSQLMANLPLYKANRPRLKLPGRSQRSSSKSDGKAPPSGGASFINFTEEDGLSSNTVYFIIFDDDKNLWIGTNKGIDKLDIDYYKKSLQKKFKHYGKEEGFLGIECNTNAVLKDSKGDLWFGTIKGAIKYLPQKDKLNLIEAKTKIIRHRVFLKDTLLPQNAVLPYDQNHISFEFIGICFTNPNKVRYSYILENFDKDWAPRTSNNQAVYSNLPPGSYTFKVESCNNDGFWNREPTTFSFTITNHPLKTKWAYGMYILAVIIGIFLFIKLRERNLIKVKRILEEKVDLHTKQLQKEKEKLQKVNINLEKLSIVASKTDNGVIITDANGNIEWANESFTRLTGYSLEEFKAKKGYNLIDTSHNPNIKQLISECIEKKHSVVYEALNYTKTGEALWVQTTLTPILTARGKVKNLVAIDSDITKIKNAQAKIRQKNMDFTDSMNYARDIQQAMLPSLKDIGTLLPESFILFIPRDIIGVDLYWFTERNGKAFVAACDCSAQGMPGAFISMIGNNLLNQTIIEKGIEDPAEVLKLLNIGFESVFSKSDGGRSLMDIEPALREAGGLGKSAGKVPSSGRTVSNGHRAGIVGGRGAAMEVALCVIDKKHKKLQFAGSRRPLYLVRNNSLQEIKGVETRPRQNRDFAVAQHALSLQKNDTLYLCSDGYANQFGGPGVKRFLNKRLKQLLLDIQPLSLDQQHDTLKKTFEKWKGNRQQFDDVLVIGIRM
ncbi:MAG: PAS domain S-box protein [Cytophagales bacterium]|nr:PAS domain S-box protein [Cytophagales bacterium]